MLFCLAQGYGLVVICNQSDTCIIECYGNSCTNTFVLCYGNCLTSNCETESSVACPTFFRLESGTFDTYQLDEHTLTTNFLSLQHITDNIEVYNRQFNYSNSSSEFNYGIGMLFNMIEISLANDNSCSTDVNALTVDNGYGRKYLNTSHSGGNICGRSEQALYGTSNSVPNTFISLMNSNFDDFDIVCSGQYSCKYVDLITTNGMGNVYCTGRLSCWKSILISNVDIYCTSYWSCPYSTVNNAKNVYCTGGYQACKAMIIYQTENVYLMGYEQHAHGTIIVSNGTDMNVYLYSYQAGYSVTVNCSNGDNCLIDCGVNMACCGLTLNCQGYCTS